MIIASKRRRKSLSEESKAQQTDARNRLEKSDWTTSGEEADVLSAKSSMISTEFATSAEGSEVSKVVEKSSSEGGIVGEDRDDENYNEVHDYLLYKSGVCTLYNNDEGNNTEESDMKKDHDISMKEENNTTSPSKEKNNGNYRENTSFKFLFLNVRESAPEFNHYSQSLMDDNLTRREENFSKDLGESDEDDGEELRVTKDNEILTTMDKLNRFYYNKV